VATVVIVDDDPNLRTFLCKVLTKRGHRVLDASNGEEALVLCRAEHPDLVITDLLMPVMDGYELVRQLRKEKGIAGTRIIFFTGTLNASEAQSLAEQCGVQQILRKPCAPAAILQAVDSALSAPEAAGIGLNDGFDRQHARVLGEMLLRNTDELATVNARLATSELEYREMFDRHPEPKYVLHAQSLVFLNVNDAAVLHYGYSREEFLGLSVFDILPADEIQAAIALLQKTRDGLVSTPGTFRHYRKDGGLIEVELTAHQLQFGGRRAYSVLARDVTQRNQYERSLRESEERLRHLAGRLQQAREEERVRLARELHDNLGQSLTAIMMDLSWLAGHSDATAKAVSARIASSMDLAAQTIDAAKRLASELRPGVLDLGLKAAVEWQAEEFRYHSDIRCDLELPPGDIPLSPDHEVAMFRIFQETLTNVARHAGASLVTTTVTVESGQVILVVQDNGRGITQNEIANRSSLGLLGMRERVLSLGGLIEIKGTRGMGTLVRVSVPVLTQPAG
jgi:PAS domain S-box-containing protein